jgi:hypothetical protein
MLESGLVSLCHCVRSRMAVLQLRVVTTAVTRVAFIVILTASLHIIIVVAEVFRSAVRAIILMTERTIEQIHALHAILVLAERPRVLKVDHSRAAQVVRADP